MFIPGLTFYFITTVFPKLIFSPVFFPFMLRLSTFVCMSTILLATRATSSAKPKSSSLFSNCHLIPIPILIPGTLRSGLHKKGKMVWWVGMGLEMSGRKMVFVLSPFVQQTLSYCINNVSTQEHTQIHLDCS